VREALGDHLSELALQARDLRLQRAACRRLIAATDCEVATDQQLLGLAHA
jgi:hypothetical protein